VQLTKTESTAGRHCPSLIECDLPSTAATHQLRQLGNVDHDPARLVARQSVHHLAPAGLRPQNRTYASACPFLSANAVPL
jgi:hypothetical protein